MEGKAYEFLMPVIRPNKEVLYLKISILVKLNRKISNILSLTRHNYGRKHK